MTRDRYESLEYDGELYSEIQHLESENDDLKKQVKELQQKNEKLQIQLADYNLFVNDILNKIHEFKEKMILGNKN